MQTLLPTYAKRLANTSAPLVQAVNAVSSPLTLLAYPLAKEVNRRTFPHPSTKGLRDMDAHHAEYAAAVDAMQNFYGRRLTPPRTCLRDGRLVDTHAVGDYVAVSDHTGQERRGHVIEARENDSYLVRCHVPGAGQEVVEVDIQQFLPF